LARSAALYPAFLPEQKRGHEVLQGRAIVRKFYFDRHIVEPKQIRIFNHCEKPLRPFQLWSDLSNLKPLMSDNVLLSTVRMSAFIISIICAYK
jgi:hypothetical protein